MELGSYKLDILDDDAENPDLIWSGSVNKSTLSDLKGVKIPQRIEARRLVDTASQYSRKLDRREQPPQYANLVRFGDWTACYYLIVPYQKIEPIAGFAKEFGSQTVEDLGLAALRSSEINNQEHRRSLLKLGGIKCTLKQIERQGVYVKSKLHGLGKVYQMSTLAKQEGMQVIVLWDKNLN